MLAACGLVYGSLLAFRAPDLRGVIAYSSLAQMGLITLGLFAVNDLGLNGAVLQMVNHGLISATLFLLAGGIERRTATGELGRARRDGAGAAGARDGADETGVIALAVPGSTAFAGEFAILAGVFQTGWGYAVVGAVAIVLAAMYMLRLISAVLHRRPGRRSPRRRSTCGLPSSASSCRSSRSCSCSRPGRRRSPTAPSAARRRCRPAVRSLP